MANIDTSDPFLKSVNIPSEAQPGRPFTVTAKVDNRHEVAVPQHGTCQEGWFGVNVAWRTPVSVHVDGEEVARHGNCTSAATAPKDNTFTLNLDEGEHRVVVKAWIKHKDRVADMVSQTVSVYPEASDPEEPSPFSGLLEDLAEQFGTSVRAIVMIGAIALVVFMVI